MRCSSLNELKTESTQRSLSLRNCILSMDICMMSCEKAGIRADTAQAHMRNFRIVQNYFQFSEGEGELFT
jgi:hypothetical protein